VKELGISIGSCQTILTEDLGMFTGLSKIYAKTLDWRSETATIFHM
jgi:hypothetical protein